MTKNKRTTKITLEDAPAIVVDTREQAPYTFDRPTEIRGLKTGDYSIVGLEDTHAVERKEINDFIGCCGKSRDRFERELERSEGMRRLWVVIEGTARDISTGRFRSMIIPESVIGSIVSWENRFDAVRFVFASDRETGKRFTEKLLLRAWVDHQAGRTF